MNDKGRLKKLQNGSVFDNDDINWLLEQAKLAELTIEQNSRLAIEFERLQIKKNQYHEALEFYANESNHMVFVPCGKSNIEHDNGLRAREALEELE